MRRTAGDFGLWGFDVELSSSSGEVGLCSRGL